MIKNILIGILSVAVMGWISYSFLFNKPNEYTVMPKTPISQNITPAPKEESLVKEVSPAPKNIAPPPKEIPHLEKSSKLEGFEKPITVVSGRDPKLEDQSRRLQSYGIDCSGENTYGIRNSFIIDPNNPNILYVGIEGRGIYKSTDEGATWKKIIRGLVAYPDSNNKSELCFPDIAAIYINPANTQRLLMVTSDITTGYVDWPYGETGGIWESLDAGESWRQMVKGKINAAGSGSLAINPKNPQIMYYPVNPDPPTFKEAPIKESLNKISSVYKTTDSGQTWKEINMPMLPGLQASVTAIDPKDSNHLLFFTQSHDHIYKENSITEVFLHKQYGVLESFDAGETWAALGDRLPAPYRALFDGDISKNNFQHLIVKPFLFGPEFPPDKTEQKSFYSTNGGQTFKQTSIYLWVGRYDPHDKNGNHLFGYYQLNGWVMESKDAGATWEKISTPQEIADGKVRISNFVWDPKNPNTVYMTGDYGNVWKSIDNGQIWNNILNLAKLAK